MTDGIATSALLRRCFSSLAPRLTHHTTPTTAAPTARAATGRITKSTLNDESTGGNRSKRVSATL